MKHHEAVELVAGAIANQQGDDEVQEMVVALAEGASPAERGMAAMRLGFLESPDVIGPLRRAVDADRDPQVRFMAAQALLVGQRDAASFPWVCRLVREMTAIGTRESLDVATNAAECAALFAGHGWLGFDPAPAAGDTEELRRVVGEALVVAERLRSRHRRTLREIATDLDRGPEGTLQDLP